MPETHITKNYFSDGGDELVIGGKLTILEGAQVENFPGTNSGGTSSKAAYLADSEASTVANLKNDFNTLLSSLRAAGLMESTAPSTEATEPETSNPDTPAEGTEDGGS